MAEHDMTFVTDIIQKLGGISSTQLESKYYMYFDETNNVKKLNANKNPEQNRILNIDNVKEHFILGGIATKEPDAPISLEELKRITHIKQGPQMQEIKSHNIIEGDFLNAIKAPKLTPILELIKQNHWFIHFSDVNLLYYSLVDIIDSLVYNSSYSSMIWNQYIFFGIKDELYRIFNKHLNENLDVLMSFDYPDVKKENLHAFRIFLANMIRRYYTEGGEINNLTALFVKVLIDSDMNNRDLVFVQDEKKGILIDSFKHFYSTRICEFTSSVLTLDNEGDIVASLQENPISMNGLKLTNYTFVDSKSNTFIQISDIVVSIIAKYLEFVDDDWKNVKNELDKLSGVSLKNLSILNEILLYSDSENKLFFEQVERVGVISNFWNAVRAYQGTIK